MLEGLLWFIGASVIGFTTYKLYDYSTPKLTGKFYSAHHIDTKTGVVKIKTIVEVKQQDETFTRTATKEDIKQLRKIANLS